MSAIPYCLQRRRCWPASAQTDRKPHSLKAVSIQTQVERIRTQPTSLVKTERGGAFCLYRETPISLAFL
jgi:hypothetical protein